MTEYTVGDAVLIKKYGGAYYGKVTAVGRTTVTVAFKTKGGAAKTVKVAGYDVPFLLERYR